MFAANAVETYTRRPSITPIPSINATVNAAAATVVDNNTRLCQSCTSCFLHGHRASLRAPKDRAAANRAGALDVWNVSSHVFSCRLGIIVVVGYNYSRRAECPCTSRRGTDPKKKRRQAHTIVLVMAERQISKNASDRRNNKETTIPSSHWAHAVQTTTLSVLVGVGNNNNKKSKQANLAARRHTVLRSRRM